MSAGRKVLVAVLVVVGLILVAGGIIYFVVKAGSLPPSSIPGKIAHSSGHRNKRGIIGVVAGVVVLIIAVVVATVGRGRRRRY